MSELVRTLDSPDRRWRIEIFRRATGTFGFEVYRWHDDDLGEHERPHWCPQRGYSISVTASADDAEREARSRVEAFQTPPA